MAEAKTSMRVGASQRRRSDAQTLVARRQREIPTVAAPKVYSGVNLAPKTTEYY